VFCSFGGECDDRAVRCGNDLDQVTAIPETVLRQNRTIDHWSLPFRIVVRNFYENSQLKMLSDAGTGTRPIANQGPGAMIAVEPLPRAIGMDERDVPCAAIEIIPKDSGGSLGTWLVSDAHANCAGAGLGDCRSRCAQGESRAHSVARRNATDRQRAVDRRVVLAVSNFRHNANLGTPAFPTRA